MAKKKETRSERYERLAREARDHEIEKDRERHLGSEKKILLAARDMALCDLKIARYEERIAQQTAKRKEIRHEFDELAKRYNIRAELLKHQLGNEAAWLERGRKMAEEKERSTKQRYQQRRQEVGEEDELETRPTKT